MAVISTYVSNFYHI